MKNNNLNCHCDMDGVLTAFDQQVIKYTGKHPKDIEKKEFYKISANFPISFWETMEWTQDGKTLWAFLIKNFSHVKILSTPAEPWKRNHNSSIIGKNLWIKRELGLNEDKIILSDRKEQFVTSKHDILIDDRIDNITKWNAKGGTGILHTSAWNSIEHLKLL